MCVGSIKFLLELHTFSRALDGFNYPVLDFLERRERIFVRGGECGRSAATTCKAY